METIRLFYMFLILCVTTMEQWNWTTADSIYNMPNDVGGLELFEGDIIVPQTSNVATPNMTRHTWPDARVFYTIHSSFSEGSVNLITAAMKEIEIKTCIQFRPRTTEKDFVHIVRDRPGCMSHLGRIGGEQIVNLGNTTCINPGTVTHELLHSLGVDHEHTRPDRNRYIRVSYFNILNNVEVQRNFARRSWDEWTNSSLPYDYESVMHYTLTAFGREQQLITLVPTRRYAYNVQIGQRDGLSVLDARKLRSMYSVTWKDYCLAEPTLETQLNTTARPRAVLYRTENKSDDFFEYSMYGRVNPICHDINYLGHDRMWFKSIDTMGTCVRIYTDHRDNQQNCTGYSIAIYPKIDQGSIFNLETLNINPPPHVGFELPTRPATGGVFVRGVGPCFENELAYSEIKVFPSGEIQYRKLTNQRQEPLIPDSFYMTLDYHYYIQATHSVGMREPRFLLSTSHRGRVEWLLVYLRLRNTNVNAINNDNGTHDFRDKATDSEKLFYQQLDSQPGDQLGHFMSSSLFPFWSHMSQFQTLQVFPMNPKNLYLLKQAEASIVEFFEERRPIIMQNPDDPRGVVQVMFTVHYDSKRSTRPKGFHCRLLYGFLDSQMTDSERRSEFYFVNENSEQHDETS